MGTPGTGIHDCAFGVAGFHGIGPNGEESQLAKVTAARAQFILQLLLSVVERREGTANVAVRRHGLRMTALGFRAGDAPPHTELLEGLDEKKIDLILAAASPRRFAPKSGL